MMRGQACARRSHWRTSHRGTCLMTSYRTFSELNLKNHRYKKLAVASAILLLAVMTILVTELIGIRNSSLHMSAHRP